MKKRTKIIIGILCGIVVLGAGGFIFMYRSMQNQLANTDPSYWDDDIQKLNEQYEDVSDVDIVLTGSSSARMWETYEEDFSDYEIVNTGFGGCKVADITAHYNDVIKRYSPEIVIFWAGTNNINGMTDNSMSGEDTYKEFEIFYELVTEKAPETQIVFLPISPSKSRWEVWNEAEVFNNSIKKLATQEENLHYVDVTNQLLTDGEYNKDYLKFDGLHLNEEGYDIIIDETLNIVDSIETE